MYIFVRSIIGYAPGVYRHWRSFPLLIGLLSIAYHHFCLSLAPLPTWPFRLISYDVNVLSILSLRTSSALGRLIAPLSLSIQSPSLVSSPLLVSYSCAISSGAYMLRYFLLGMGVHVQTSTLTSFRTLPLGSTPLACVFSYRCLHLHGLLVSSLTRSFAF